MRTIEQTVLACIYKGCDNKVKTLLHNVYDLHVHDSSIPSH
jgi:hypothetical protein